MAVAVARLLPRALRAASKARQCPLLQQKACLKQLPRPARSFAVSARRLDDASDQGEPGHDVRYTTDLMPNLKRDSRYGELTKEHIDFFKKTLADEAGVIDGFTQDASDDLEPFNRDWMKKYRGRAKVVLKPKNTEEVSKILQYCNENMLAVVPQGGNSGLVGGSVPVFDEVVINLMRMNKIRSFDDISGILTADAGVIMENADNYLRERGHVYPLDLGAKGSAQIGGNVAANAGGLRFLRYGSLHGNVLGIEAVLPDGTIMNDLVKLRKNNTGYDLKQLFIGAEGTIGIITGIALHCPQHAKAVNVAFFGLESYDKVLQAYKEAKLQLGEILSAFELMDAESQKFVDKHIQAKRPIEGEFPFYCLIETSGSNGEHDNEKLEKFLESVMGDEIVADGVVAQDDTQISELWQRRERITESIGAAGGTYKFDLSIPVQNLYEIVEDTRKHLESKGLIGDGSPALGVVGFGHMGDGNIHLNIPVTKYVKEIEEALEPWVYEWVSKHNGSISAEHGLGIMKKPYIGYSRNETMIKLMKQIKDLYDPKGIMMPYKYI